MVCAKPLTLLVIVTITDISPSSSGMPRQDSIRIEYDTTTILYIKVKPRVISGVC